MVAISYPNILLDALENGIIIIDHTFVVRYWNRWLEINTGIEAVEIIGNNLQTFYPEIDYNVLSRKIRTTLRLSSPTFYDATLTNRFIPIPRSKITTSLLPMMQLQVTISPYIPSEGMVMVSIYDISNLHELKLNLQEQMGEIAQLNAELQRDKAIIDSNLLIAKIDVECNVIEVTEAFSHFFGYSHEEFIGRSLGIVHGGGLLEFDALHMRDELAKKQRWSGEMKAVLSDGNEVWLDTVVTAIIGFEGELEGYTAIFSDISDKKRIELLSITDPLTKLFNRHKFNEVFENMLMRRHWNDGYTFGFIIADIDYFKEVNDAFGHQAGDKALVNAAQIFTQTIRSGDVLARWGGEEFVFLLPDVDKEKVLHVAEKLRMAIANNHVEGIGEITISLGVCIYKEGDTQESMLARADRGLYKAKEEGRNLVKFVDNVF